MYTLKAANVTGVFHDSHLHAQAYSQVGNFVLTSPLGGRHHSLSSSRAKSTRDQDSVCSTHVMPRLMELRGIANVNSRLQRLGLNPHKVQLPVAMHSRMLQTLHSGEVRVVEIGVLSDKRNCHCLVQAVLSESQGLPLLPQVGTLLDVRLGDVDLVQRHSRSQKLDKLLVVQKDRHVVSGVDVVDRDNLLVVDIAKEGNLLDGSRVKGLRAAAGNLFSKRQRSQYLPPHSGGDLYQIGRQSSGPNISDSRLGRLRLLLATNDRHQRNVDLQEVTLTSAPSKLTQGFDERRGLDITNGSSELDNANIRLLARLVDWDLCDTLDPILNGIRQVRDHLYGLSEVVTSSL